MRTIPKPTRARRFCIGLLSLASILGAASCTREEPEGETFTDNVDALIGGTLTFVHPEIGLSVVGGAACTATLVSENAAITAAHCVGFGTRDAAGTSSGRLTLYRSASESQNFTIQGYRSFGARGDLTNDVALLHLATKVPENFARPAAIASSYPAAGAPLTLFGFGCTSRSNTSAGQSQKRLLETSYGTTTKNLCPGDSGGPTLIDATSEVLRINSAYNVGSGADIYSDPVRNYQKLIDQITAWGGTPGKAQPPTAPPPPAPGSDATAPQVSLTSPADGASLPEKSVIQVVGTATDNVGISGVELVWRFTADVFPCPGSAAAWSCTQSGSTYTWKLNVGTGDRTFLLRARDAAGNVGSTAERTIHLTAGAPAPAPTPSVPPTPTPPPSNGSCDPAFLGAFCSGTTCDASGNCTVVENNPRILGFNAPAPANPTYAEVRAYSLAAVNAIRARTCLPALTEDSCLDGIAESALAANNTHGYFIDNCMNAAHNFGRACTCNWAQENIGAAYGTSRNWTDGIQSPLCRMMTEPKGRGHRSNIESAEWKRIGIGASWTSSGATFYHEFGR